jgi:hypothetical protein
MLRITALDLVDANESTFDARATEVPTERIIGLGDPALSTGAALFVNALEQGPRRGHGGGEPGRRSRIVPWVTSCRSASAACGMKTAVPASAGTKTLIGSPCAASPSRKASPPSAGQQERDPLPDEPGSGVVRVPLRRWSVEQTEVLLERVLVSA